MQQVPKAGLTTGHAPFIEEARGRGDLFIQQPFSLYTEQNHLAWKRLFHRMRPQWEQYATPRFLQGLEQLHLPADRIPNLTDVNRRLEPLTGFQAKPVAGYVPAFLFFDCLRHRLFPTTVTIRDAARLDYLPEPDIFHDVAGHVPMDTDAEFAACLVRIGEFAHTAATIAGEIRDRSQRLEVTSSIIRGLARFFWFTVEFGLVRTQKGVRAYGSGLLSSHGELEHALISPEVQRSPAQLEWMIHQGFEIHHYQPLLFVVDSFEHLYELVGELERMLLAGKLSNVAPGEPAVNAADLESFLAGGRPPLKRAS